jgi:hypothetical protein
VKRTLAQILTRRGNDGLTKKEREALAEDYIRKAGSRLTEQEKEAFVAWRERRL